MAPGIPDDGKTFPIKGRLGRSFLARGAGAGRVPLRGDALGRGLHRGLVGARLVRPGRIVGGLVRLPGLVVHDFR